MLTVSEGSSHLSQSSDIIMGCHEPYSQRGGTSGRGWLWHLWELSWGLLGVSAEFIMTCEAGLWGRRKLINHVVSEICQKDARLWLMWPRRRREDCGSSRGLVECSADSTGFRLVAQKTAFYIRVSLPAPFFCPKSLTQMNLWRSLLFVHLHMEKFKPPFGSYTWTADLWTGRTI